MKKKLLALTGVWSGVRPFFFEADENVGGMPAFFNVFKRLSLDERVEKVHLLLFVDTLEQVNQVNIPEKYKDKLVIYPYHFNPRSFFHSLWLFAKVVIKGYRIGRQNEVVEVVGFGSLAGLSAIIAKLLGIKDFRRLYGSFLINEIRDSKTKLFIKHPLEFLCFFLSGKALLITNDGTKGDVVFEKLGDKKLPFYFPINGVDRNIESTMEKPDFELPTSFLTYIARLDDWKRQHLLVEALGILKRKNVTIPTTYIIGSVISQKHLARIENAIINNKIEDKVLIIKGLPAKQVHYMMKHSLISYSLYHTSNLGNVYLEALRLGTPMIALNDTNSLAQFPKNIFYEILSSEPEIIAAATENLLQNEAKRVKIGSDAKTYADCEILNWDERSKLELDIILN
jgi:glycosyltransferase involved in cell wall biosynthesis